jgi:hypothetical protein
MIAVSTFTSSRRLASSASLRSCWRAKKLQRDRFAFAHFGSISVAHQRAHRLIGIDPSTRRRRRHRLAGRCRFAPIPAAPTTRGRLRG